MEAQARKERGQHQQLALEVEEFRLYRDRGYGFAGAGKPCEGGKPRSRR